LAAGRDFSSQDEGRAPVAILNESMARDLFGDRSPLGGHVTLNHATGHGDDQTYEIVGVAGDAKYNDLHEAAPRTIYLDAFEQDRISNQLSLRTQIDPEATATAVRQKVASVMKGVSIVRVRTMTDQVDASIVPERVIAALSEWFGVLGALLAAIGLYGLLAYRVSRRTRELGVRMALGARRSDLMRMVLREALGMVGAGVVIGIPLAVWGRKVAATLISNLLTGSETPIILGALAMVAVALLACWIPARRAMRVDPIEALRYE
jgi:predicted lysophospholipase L1 biosynthesis ABC-type transport system permease subunit